jgi:hypothetical protein
MNSQALYERIKYGTSFSSADPVTYTSSLSSNQSGVQNTTPSPTPAWKIQRNILQQKRLTSTRNDKWC